MVLVYSVGHISGAHFNPAITLAFATCKRFPRKEVPFNIACQVTGSTLARSWAIRLIFQGHQDQFTGTLPSGSDMPSFVVEFIITFYLMFVISCVATDNRAIGELAGIAVGATVLNVMLAVPISGASMDPVRSLGPATVSNKHKGMWIFKVEPILGAQGGAWVYNMIRYTDDTLREITKSASFVKSQERA